MLVTSCGFMGAWLTWLGPRTHRGDLGSLEGEGPPPSTNRGSLYLQPCLGRTDGAFPQSLILLAVLSS